MRALPTLLVCSLAANAALVGVCLSKPDWVAQVANVFRSPPASTPAAPQAVRSTSLPDKGIWSSIDGSHIADAMLRLKAAGLPDRFVRAIGLALLNDKYRQKSDALLADAKTTPYWKSNGWRLTDKNFTPQFLQLSHEQQDEARTLGLKDDVDNDIISDLQRKRRYGDLSSATIDKIEKIQADYILMRQELVSEHNGNVTKDVSAKMTYLMQQQQTDLAQTLTPDELETYQLHSSPSALNVQRKLQYFDASEAEYKAVFDAEQSVSAYQNAIVGGRQTPADTAQLKQLEDAAEQQVASALGPDRYAEYQKDTSQAYSFVAAALTPYNVSQANIDQVYSMSKTSQDQFAAIMKDPTLSPADKVSQAAGIAAQASASLSSLLGNDAFQAYRAQAGFWLNPPPRTGTPASMGETVLQLDRMAR